MSNNNILTLYRLTNEELTRLEAKYKQSPTKNTANQLKTIKSKLKMIEPIYNRYQNDPRYLNDFAILDLKATTFFK